MISFEDAYRLVLSQARHFGIESIPLREATGRVLYEEWFADRDLPPYDRVTMDGIAISYDGTESDRSIPIEGIAAAGDPQKRIQSNKACLEVMTGSILPMGTDTVIRYEDLSIEGDIATIKSSFNKGQNIHYKGEDRKNGDLLVSRGVKLSQAEIGIGSSIGKSDVSVSRLPKTMVISTGNELVDIDLIPLAHQIRKSNVYRIEATLKSKGLEVDTMHLQDNYDEIIPMLSKVLQEYDLIVLSGGVSKGKYDFIPEALEELGVEKLFHKVCQRPGKPFWFGHQKDACTVFAFPGNPVSSFMCTQVYLLDWLDVSLGLGAPVHPSAILQEDISFAKDLTYFMEVKLAYGDDGTVMAYPQKGNGSGDMVNLSLGDAFMKFPATGNLYLKGTAYPIYSYR